MLQDKPDRCLLLLFVVVLQSVAHNQVVFEAQQFDVPDREVERRAVGKERDDLDVHNWKVFVLVRLMLQFEHFGCGVVLESSERDCESLKGLNIRWISRSHPSNIWQRLFNSIPPMTRNFFRLHTCGFSYLKRGKLWRQLNFAIGKFTYFPNLMNFTIDGFESFNMMNCVGVLKRMKYYHWCIVSIECLLLGLRAPSWDLILRRIISNVPK